METEQYVQYVYTHKYVNMSQFILKDSLRGVQRYQNGINLMNAGLKKILQKEASPPPGKKKKNHWQGICTEHCGK